MPVITTSGTRSLSPRNTSDAQGRASPQTGVNILIMYSNVLVLLNDRVVPMCVIECV